MTQETAGVKEVLERKMGEANVKIDELSVRVSHNEQKLERFMAEVGKRLGDGDIGQLPHSEAAIGQSSGSFSYAAVAAGASRPVRSPRPTLSKEDHYWNCRRSLRLMPIRAGDDREEVEHFISQYLEQDSLFIRSLGDFTVQRIPFGPKSRNKNEAVVRFSSVDIRDAVKAAARNLAGRGPEYGVRLELPNHLKSAMKSLQSLSYEIKKKHGQARRNVLFNDECQDLVLDVCLSEGRPWRRITAKQARERMAKSTDDPKRRLAVDDDELDGILNERVSGSPNAGEQTE